MNLLDSRNLFKIDYRVDPIDLDSTRYELSLKETNAYFGYIKEYINELGEQVHQFIGYSWMGNDVDDTGELIMRYPTRYSQYEELPTEYLALELESSYNQALIDAGHFYRETRSFVFPDYSPLTLK